MLSYYEDELGECQNCYWYENGICQNPDAEYAEAMEPDEGCNLWEEE